jgi:hypothetical protein
LEEKMKRRLISLAFMAVLLLSACNFPLFGATTTTGTETGGGAETQPPVIPTSTNTVEVAGATATTTLTLVPSATVTLTPTNTQTLVPCNLATYITDVTIPDNTSFAPGTTFTKTWRIQNVGSCTWTSGYSLVFFNGDQMSGAASVPLTSGTVAPGQTVDVSVNLTAPAAAGTYRGNWKFREPGGVIFGTTTNGPVWVQIVVSPPAAVTVNLALVQASSGFVLSDGSMYSARNAGDINSDLTGEAFVTFDMSAIPAGAVIQSAKVDLSDYDTLGDPFGSLGNLRMVAQNYGTVSVDDFVAGPPVGALLGWGSTGDMNMVTSSHAGLVAYLQTRVGTTKAQFRFQMDFLTDLDGVTDMVRLGTGIKLIVTYTAP